jgi:hypothetical protein
VKKIRTITELQDVLDREFAWRLREIHDLRSAARSADSASQRTFIRAGVALLYAHWEGFVKQACEAYVNHLACKGLRYRDLQRSLIALGLRGKLTTLATSGRVGANLEALAFILDELDKPAKLPLRDAVDTESNLSSDVFRNIVGWVGIDPGRYETKFNFLDRSLLERRNRIAHGEFLDVDEAAFEAIVDETLLLLRWVKTDIENAVATESFRSGAA